MPERRGRPPERADFGALLRSLREQALLSQEQLAERSGLSLRGIGDLERGRVRTPRRVSVRLLADALGLTGDQREQFVNAAQSPQPASPATASAPGTPAPCLLPPAVADFTGRRTQLARLDELLSDTTTPRAIAVAGKAGVGKTTLAVHVAHQLRQRFPDGQLYVDLHGAEPQPLPPAVVLARFLRALGVDGSRHPSDAEERLALYRSRLADRAGAGRAGQRGHRSPGPPAAAGHRRLWGAGDQPRPVDRAGGGTPAGPGGARGAAVARAAGPHRLGPQRVAADPAAAAAIVGHCGRLPLAIRIAGARLAARPAWSLARLAGRLADEHRRLDELAAGDLEVRASIDLSYRTLPERRQQAFRRLGLLEAPDFPSWVAAALLDLPAERADDLLDRLVDAQLLEIAGEDPTGQLRYRLHDLLRVYARECALGDDHPAERSAALARVVGGWLVLAGQAAPAVKAGTLGLAHGGGPRWRPGDAVTGRVDADPLGWFEVERVSLVTAVEQAADAGLDECAWDLAGCLARFFVVRSYFDDWRRTQEIGVAAAGRVGDRAGQAHLLRGLGQLHNEQDRLDDAAACFEQARALFIQLGDLAGEAGILDELGVLHQLRGRTDLALACLEPALTTFARAGDPVGEANVRFSLGMVHLDQGRYDQAETSLEKARPILEAVGDRYTLAQLLRKLAQLHRTQGRLDQAAAALDRCLAVDRALGDRLGEALTLQSLGELQRLQDQRHQAQATLEQALVALRDLGYPFGEALTLHSLGMLHLTGGRPRQALAELGESLALWRRLGRPRNEARTLTSLGDARAMVGERPAAEDAWRAALTIFEELDAPDTEALAARLSPQSQLAGADEALQLRLR